MRTTITLEDDVATRLQAEARRSGRPFKVVINEFLRAGLAQRRLSKAVESFKIEPVSMGALSPGRSYDNVGALLEEIEGVERR
jgi:predicted transcriptional regulator